MPTESRLIVFVLLSNLSQVRDRLLSEEEDHLQRCPVKLARLIDLLRGDARLFHRSEDVLLELSSLGVAQDGLLQL